MGGLGGILVASSVRSAFGSVNSGKQTASPNNTSRAATLTGRQYADEDDVRPFVNRDEDENAEHARHEEREERLRERAHEFGERQEDRADRLKEHLNRERAEHERHEMNEHPHGED